VEWPISVKGYIEDGITIKYCYKCFGDTTIVHPTKTYDNLQVRMIRNCATHIQNVTTGVRPTGILAPNYPTYDYNISVNMTELWTFIDESDCGKVTCGLYESDCSTVFNKRNVTVSTVHPFFTISAAARVYEDYSYSNLCIKCASKS